MEYTKLGITVDTVIFTIKDNELRVLLIKRNIEPFKGSWALPGGFVREKENLDQAAKRELEEETGVRNVYLEQLYSFGEVARDPRGKIITIAYMALVNSEQVNLRATSDASDAQWFSMLNLPRLAFDHDKILSYAFKRLRWKFEYTAVAFSLLSKKFAISEIQKIYEVVFHKGFDKRNFAKKLLSLNILKEEGIKRDVSHRPPMLYSLKEDIGEIIEIL